MVITAKITIKIKPKILMWECARKMPGADETRISLMLFIVSSVPRVTPISKYKKPVKIKFRVILLITSFLTPLVVICY